MLVRVRPIIGTKLWFVPRRDPLGWGWSPASWEGWAVIAVAIALITVPTLVAATVKSGLLRTLVWDAGVTVALIATAALKGTTPGGRDRYEEFRRATGR